MENAYSKKLNEIEKLNKETELLTICTEAFRLSNRNNDDNLLKRAMPSESYTYVEEQEKTIEVTFEYKKSKVFCLDSILLQNKELEIVNQVRNRFTEILNKLEIKYKFEKVDCKMINWYGGKIIVEKIMNN